MFGSPETTTGGNALKFYASVRMDIRRIGSLKSGEEAIGNRTRVKVVKNKLAPPFREVEFDIMYGTGISREGDLLDLASENNVIEKSGAWFAFGGERIGQGRENAKEFLKSHPDVYNNIERRVLEHFAIHRRIGEGGANAAAPAPVHAEKPATMATDKNGPSAASSRRPAAPRGEA
jgi:recombination protein RecA